MIGVGLLGTVPNQCDIPQEKKLSESKMSNLYFWLGSLQVIVIGQSLYYIEHRDMMEEGLYAAVSSDEIANLR